MHWWVVIGSANGLSPDQCQAIIWTNADIVNLTNGKKLKLNF